MDTMYKRREWLTKSLAATAALGLSSNLQAFGHPIFKNTAQAPFDPEVKRLLFNENPLGPSKRVQEIIREILSRASQYATFHEYDFMALKALIAKQEGLQPSNVLLGHGSFEPLTMVSSHFGKENGEIIVPSPSFDVVGNFGRKIGAQVVPVEVDKNFKMDLDAMAAKMTPKTKLITICNPNNPTGTHCNPEALSNFCKQASQNAFVLIDEAYIHYLENWRSQTMAPLVTKGNNVLVTRTFSKIYGMAGLRIGYLLGPELFIKEMEAKYTLGFPGNMPNSLSVAAAIIALQDDGFLTHSRAYNSNRKLEFYEALETLGLDYVKSSANFVYFNVENFKAFKKLMWKDKILLTGGWPTQPKWARVTMGSKEDMDFLVAKMQGKEWM